MLLPPPSAPTATGWSDSCRAGFAPTEEWRLSRGTLKYTLRAWLEPSGPHEAVEGRTGHARELGDGGLGNPHIEDGEALAAHVLLCGRDPQIGNGFHGLTMEYGFVYLI